jgi:hypothetical protein
MPFGFSSQASGPSLRSALGTPPRPLLSLSFESVLTSAGFISPLQHQSLHLPGFSLCSQLMELKSNLELPARAMNCACVIFSFPWRLTPLWARAINRSSAVSCTPS